MDRPSHGAVPDRLGGTPHSGAVAGVVGRDAELARLTGILDEACAGRARAIVITGEPGMGKTTILEAATSLAERFRVVRTRGVSSEAAMPYGALLQLATPLSRFADQLPTPQRRALSAALGWSEPDTSLERHLIAAGTLSLLATAAAEESPLLVVVDDLQWLDGESAAAVLFAARRLDADRVATLISTRPGGPYDLDALAALDLAGLDAGAARSLLPPATSPAVATRLLDASRGNPLVLNELARRLSPAQRRGAEPLPHPLPSVGASQAIFAPTVEGQGPDRRRAMLIVAAAFGPEAGPIRAGIGALGLDADGLLRDLERDGLLSLRPGEVDFRHPLLRATAWESADPSEQREAHAALAAAPAITRSAQVWHRLAATTGPDDRLAADLDALATDARRRNGYLAAAAALEHAARVTTDPEVAAARLAGAAEDAALGGDAHRAQQRARKVLQQASDDTSLARAHAVLGAMEEAIGSLRLAARHLEMAARLSSGPSQVRALAELVSVRFRLDDIDGMAAAAGELAELADRDDARQRFLDDWATGLVAFLAGDHRLAAARHGAAVELLETEPELGEDPRYLVPGFVAGSTLELTPALLGLADRLLDNARARGALAPLVPAMTMYAYARARIGDHVGAFADAGEAVQLAEDLGFVADAAPALELLAQEHASRGLHDEAERALSRAADLVARAQATEAAAHLALAQAYCALCRGDPAGVVAALEARMAADAGRGSQGEPLGVAPLLIEGYVLVGDGAAAVELADRFAALAEPDGPTRALIARCKGLAEEHDAVAVAAYEQAIIEHQQVLDAPFELARTELLLGSRLRRTGQRRAARRHLRAARERFSRMDHTLWVQRCTAELAATGETRRHDDAGSGEPLTAQEARVAQLAAKGRTNAEIAAALFVSPKTVEHHLTSVYRKRRVRSRTELAQHLLSP